MTIKQKIIAIITLLTTLALGVSLFELSEIKQLNSNINKFHHQRLSTSNELNSILLLMNENRAQIMLSLQHRKESIFFHLHDHPLSMHLNELIESSKKIKEIHDQLDQLTGQSDSYKTQYQAFWQAYNIFQNDINQVREFLMAENFLEANKLLLLKINPNYKDLKKQGDLLLEEIKKTTQQEYLEGEAHYIEIRNIIFVSIIILLLASLSVGYSLVRALVEPISQLKTIFHHIGKGRYQTEIHVRRQDEFASIFAALSEMQSMLAQHITEMQNLVEESTIMRMSLDNASTNFMVADVNGKIIYMNHSTRQFFDQYERELQKILPSFKASQVLGSNIDNYHQTPTSIRTKLSTLNQPYKRMIQVSRFFLNFTLTPIVGKNSQPLAYSVEWNDQTAEINTQEEIRDVIQAASMGQLKRKINLTNKTGNMLSISQYVNNLLTVIDDMLSEISEAQNQITHGNLNVFIHKEYDGIFKDLKDNTNAMVKSLTDLVQSISDATRTLNNASTEIATGNVDLSHRTEQQAIELEKATHNITYLTQTVSKNAENAQQASDFASRTSQIAEQGGKVVRNVVTTMADINKSAHKISEIIDVIDSIAFQTNILALNASVEAARAGEQGRGFAVVAAEVRNLAQRSAGAAREINALITESVSKVNNGSHLVEEAGKTMEEIVSSVQAVTTRVSDIARASTEQSHNISDIKVTIDKLDENTQQNAALVEEAAASSEALREQVQELSRSVAFFKFSV